MNESLNKKLSEMFEMFKYSVEQLLEDDEYIVQKNLEAVEKYKSAKKWGKTKAKDELVAKYTYSGGLIKDDTYFYALEVSDIPGQPVDVYETAVKHIGYKAPWHYHVGTQWTATISDDNDIHIKANKTDTIEVTDELMRFIAANGISVERDIIKAHLGAVALGFKVQTKLENDWCMFSPIRDNGIILNFYKNKDGKSYVA